MTAKRILYSTRVNRVDDRMSTAFDAAAVVAVGPIRQAKNGSEHLFEVTLRNGAPILCIARGDNSVFSDRASAMDFRGEVIEAMEKWKVLEATAGPG